MDDASTPSAPATRRGFLGFLARASATLAIAPATARPAMPPPHRGASEHPALSDAEARRQLLAMKWDGPRVSTTPPLSQDQLQWEWDNRSQEPPLDGDGVQRRFDEWWDTLDWSR